MPHNDNFFIIGDPKDNDLSKMDDLNNGLEGEKHVFLFVFMDGCGPCNSTKETWDNIKNKMKSNNGEKFIAARVNAKYFDKLKNAGKEPSAFPTLRYVKGDKIEEYEDSDIKNKDRSAESFVDWLESKLDKEKEKEKKMTGGGRTRKNKNKRGSRKRVKNSKTKKRVRKGRKRNLKKSRKY